MAPIADALLAVLAPILPHVPESYVSWKPGVTPLSTWPSVTAALVAYLSTIFGIQSLLKDQQAKRLNTLFQVHNLFLTLGSGILFVLMVEEIAPIFWKHGLFYAVCGEGAWTAVSHLYQKNGCICQQKLMTDLNVTQRLEFYYIVNYAFKYVELIDTVFLTLKKKPLSTSCSFYTRCRALGQPVHVISSFLACLPPLCYCRIVLYSTQWQD